MISSFLLQAIPRHDTRVFEVREAFKRTLLLGFGAYISAYIAKKIASGGLPGGPCGGLNATDAGPLINALVQGILPGTAVWHGMVWYGMVWYGMI